MFTNLQKRLAALPVAWVAERVVLRAGTMADYRALARFHYRAGRPATVMRVWTMEDCRSLDAKNPAGVRPSAIVGVLVESMPVLSCRLRDVAFGRRLSAREVNEQLRCISRVIVHRRWRGLGLGIALVKHALATATTSYTEALAAMGQVHPLFDRAGMRRWMDGDRPPRADRPGAKVYYLHCNQPGAASRSSRSVCLAGGLGRGVDLEEISGESDDAIDQRLNFGLGHLLRCLGDGPAPQKRIDDLQRLALPVPGPVVNVKASRPERPADLGKTLAGRGAMSSPQLLDSAEMLKTGNHRKPLCCKGPDARQKSSPHNTRVPPTSHRGFTD
jgi:GNAT superfamily N-acetyltransferase